MGRCACERPRPPVTAAGPPEGSISRPRGGGFRRRLVSSAHVGAIGSDGGGSMQLRMRGMRALAIAAILTGAAPVAAQITTGNITGTVNDSQGGVIPGATVVLKSETRGTSLAPVVTNEAGGYVFANVTPDVYTIEV